MIISKDRIDLAFDNLCELACDLEGLADDDLLDCRDAMLDRVNECLSLLNDDGYGDN